MKRQIQFLIIVSFLFSKLIYSEDEAEIDLNLGTITSNNGLRLRYRPLRLKVFEANVDKKTKIASIPGAFNLKLVDPITLAYIDSSNGRFDTSGKSGSFGESIGFLQVGALTGAEKPNDKIYFGASKVTYSNDKIYLKDSWLTTDYKVFDTKDRLTTGYHLKADTIEIEFDKQITLKNVNLYLGKYDVTPFSFPWYRFNIRKNSEVPLFPTWGNDDDYGWNISTGFLWGDRDSFYRGGLAPKFADKLGFLIGRMENWFDFGVLGKTELNVTDWLFYKKSDKNDVVGNFDRWDINFNHSYKAENGYLNFDYRNATYNMISSLDDAIDKCFGTNNGYWNYINGIADKGGNLGFYNLKSEINEKDIYFKADMNLVSNKEVYGVMIADELNDLGYGAMTDYDLKTDIALKKENDRYSIGGYYNYLYDMDPGSSKKDLQSRAENFGFNIDDKKYNIHLSYDDKKGNKYRELNSWERIPNFSEKNNAEYYGIKLDYTPWTVEEYTKYDSKDIKASFGEYQLYKDLKYRFGYSYNSFERELSLEDDPFRKMALGVPQNKNIRDMEYNRYENITYNNFTENRGFLTFIYNDFELGIAGGTTKEEIHDREGLYTSKDLYNRYINNSQFYETSLKMKNLSLNKLGELTLSGDVRFDNYTDGYTTKKISTDDSSIRYGFSVGHNIELYDGNTTRFENSFNYDFQHYSYIEGEKKNITKDIRLATKDNFYKIEDTADFEVAGLKANYKINYEEITRAYNNLKKGENLSQKLNLGVSDNNLELTHSFKDRYTDKNLLNENHKDLSYENYGFSYNFKNNRFYFKSNRVTSDIWNISGVENSIEKIDENIYGYSYDNEKYNFKIEYSDGKDRRVQADKEVIDNKNDNYSISYLLKGEIEQKYLATYSQYRNKGAWNTNLSKYNSDTIFLSYSYKDKRYSDEELRDLAVLEYEKSTDEVTEADIEAMREMLEERASNNLNSFFFGEFSKGRNPYLGDAKRGFYSSLMLQLGEKGFTNDIFNSLERLEGRLFLKFNRIELGYIYNQKADYNLALDSWIDSEREHEFSLKTKIGKPTKSWSLRAYIKFYDQLAGRTDKNSRSSFDGFGIEIGREFGYFEWAVAYERDYSYRSKEYEWNVALQFRLLTFPTTNIFGVGASVNRDKKVNPETYLFDGIDIEDIN